MLPAAICFTQNEAPNFTKSFLVFPDTASPDGRYAIAWGLPNHSEIWSKVYQFENEHPSDAELSDEDLKRAHELFESVLDVANDVENYIVDVRDGRIVHKLGCPRAGGATSDLPEYWVAHGRPNRHHLEVLWSRSGNIVLINHTFRWDCVSFCAVPVYAGQTGSELDLNKVLGDAVRSFVAKSFPRGSGYSKKDLDVSFSNLHQVGDNQFSVQADAEFGKDWSSDGANVDFSLSPSPKGQTKVLKMRVSS